MINITRSKTIPQSLQNPKIQQYLDDLADYKSQTTDANRKKPEPPVDYRNSDILEEFDKSFFAKCYLTEKKFVNSHNMDIDHFIPKNEAPEKRYDWENLFPIEHNANMARPRKTPEGGYLNPCEPQDDVEKDILYDIGINGNRCDFRARNTSNLKAENTAKLLHKIHNGEGGKPSQTKTQQLRTEIKKRYDELALAVIKWQYAEKNGTEDDKFRASNELRLLLSRKASFTMLMRSSEIVRIVRKDFPDDFLD